MCNSNRPAGPDTQESVNRKLLRGAVLGHNYDLSHGCLSPCSCGDNFCPAKVDHFLGVVPELHARHIWSQMLGVLDELSPPTSATLGHLSLPSIKLVALGIQFDLDDNTVSLPEDKLHDIIEILHSWKLRDRATKRQIQQLLGKLLHASRVIRPGRIYLS